MPDFTRLNLMDVEDMAPRFGMAPQAEGRFARDALGLEQCGLTLFRFAPGFRLPFGHRHGEQEEVYVVLEGSMRIKVEDEVVELGPLDALRVPGPLARGMEAGPEGVRLLAFGAPNTENKDAEMLPGWWGED
jgi:quercetin dioxygenase-like cupin family protein